MLNMIWWLVAKLVAMPVVANYLIKRSFKTPYFDLPGYMRRWWLFNGYGNTDTEPDESRHERKYKWLPSIRIHHILREDDARDMHDHPWDARTLILKGWYMEERMLGDDWEVEFLRKEGDTASLKFGEYHNIAMVSPGGVWTMFFTWDYKGGWGFLVDGKKVPWREYTNAGAA